MHHINRVFNCILIALEICRGVSLSTELHCNQKNCGGSGSKYERYTGTQSFVEDSPYMISPEDFYHKFLTQHRPIVMRKDANNWPASKVWTEEYLIHSLNVGTQVSVTIGIPKFPFGSKMSLSVHEFLRRSQQEDLTLFDEPTNQMLNDITAPLCLRCSQFMQNMRIFYWLRQYQTQASTPLFFNANEQLLTVLNGSAQVILVSPLYSEKLSTGDKELWAITRSNKDFLSKLSSEAIPHFSVDLQKGDLLYIPQMWWQHITLSATHNLFVQFLWPSSIPRDDHSEVSVKTKGNQLSSMQESLQRLLRKYEEGFLTADVQSLDCPQQDMRMSSYTFETGKMNEEEYQAIHNGPDYTEGEPCNFDGSNKQSPCNFGLCLENPESSECIRYILDYCNQWEDRGCIIELPQLLNKVGMETMKQITDIDSPYRF